MIESNQFSSERFFFKLEQFFQLENILFKAKFMLNSDFMKSN